MSAKKKDKPPLHYCDLPFAPERQLDREIDPNRFSLIRHIEKKWVNHTVLHFAFLEKPKEFKGNNEQKQAVRNAFAEWKDVGIGLEFTEVTDASAAELRIGFQPGGSWSYVGRDAIDLVPDAKKRTMNFGWDLTTAYGHDTALHEIGHALGFPHEHQNPNAGIVWNEQAVYEYFSQAPNYWDKEKTDYNIINKISSSEVEGSQWDKDSIMHYQFQKGLITVPEKYKTKNLIPSPGLSSEDIREVKHFYPAKEDKDLPEIVPFSSQLIAIEPGEQLDFLIKPSVSRNYIMQTFGSLDTVMVLFEDSDKEPIYLAGNDDSGSDLNAKIKHRLINARTYILRIRLYFSNSAGEGALMLWH